MNENKYSTSKNTNQVQNVNPLKKTWESPNISKWDLSVNLNLKSKGVNQDGTFIALTY